MKKLLIIILLFCTAISAQNWEIVGKMANPVSNGQAVVIGDKIYILGGYSDSTQSSVDWIQMYEPDSNKWSIVGHLTSPKSDFIADKYKNGIYYFGGSNIEFDSLSFGDYWDEDEKVNLGLYSLDTNLNRIAAEGVICDSIFYIFGGYPQPETNALLPYIVGYNLITSTVTYVDTHYYRQGFLPQHQMAVGVKNSIYLFGGAYNGVSNEINIFHSDVREFVDNSFNLYEPRAAGSAVYNEQYNTIFIIGGFNESKVALSSVEKINLNKDYMSSTEFCPDLIFGRTNLMAVSYRENIYVFGGKDENGNVVSEIEIFNATDVTSSIEQSSTIESYKLDQNYPNPFNPSTIISYEILEKSNVTLLVYNVLGKEVKNLVNKNQNTGRYNITFNAENLPSGIYFYKLNAGNFSQTKKMVLVK